MCVREFALVQKSEGITAGIEISDCEIFEEGRKSMGNASIPEHVLNGAVYVTFQVTSQDHLHDIIISNNYIQ